jgi:plasmid replication initiation protein
MSNEAEPKPKRGRRPNLVPYVQSDLFEATMVEWPVKDDLASMEFPLFSLSTIPDTTVREYHQAGTNKRVRIIPSVMGAATVFDKDLLLFIGSQIIEGRKAGLPISNTVKFDSYSFLQGTSRQPCGKAYANILDMLRRLKGTQIETNIVTGGQEQTKGFGWIHDYTITKSATTSMGDGVLECIVQISDWMYNALLHYEVLTIDRRYFALRMSLERRLYELARKHVGSKPIWKADMSLMLQKCGSTQDLRHFRADVRKIIQRDSLPDYRMALDTSVKPQKIVFYTRNNKALSAELVATGKAAWFEKLERCSPK